MAAVAPTNPIRLMIFVSLPPPCPWRLYSRRHAALSRARSPFAFRAASIIAAGYGTAEVMTAAAEAR